MCRYIGYILSAYALALGTFYAYMLYDVINTVHSIANGPLGSLGALFGAGGGSSLPPLGSRTAPPTTTQPPITMDASKAAIHQFINEKMKDVKKREQYLREFLPDCGLTDVHFKEMNKILDGLQFDRLKDYETRLGDYVRKIADPQVKQKALAKLKEFSEMTVDIDDSIERLAEHIMKEEL
ncbi:hypothetical protein M3Y94_00234500 [Aphelenchoides besseyi]|nr:hypothetical protein M3Y94_00234500 [Aphelenchoides besseyi]KAI6236407.1 hypothetical protein M3Y95_00154300 [Aphelenchoides besseyi]